MNKEYDLLLKKCSTYISGRSNRFYEILLSTCDHAYMADENNLSKENIVTHTINALKNNQTSIQAISKISKYDLLNDVIENDTYYLKNEMVKIINGYNINIIDQKDVKRIAENSSAYKNELYICLDDENDIIAVDNTGSEVFMESFDSIDEALAYLMIYSDTYNYEASLITSSNNYMLQEALEEQGYLIGENEVKKQKYIDSLYEELKLYELDINKSQLYNLTYEEIETISHKLDLIRKNFSEISNIISKENIKQKEEIQYEKDF